MFASSSRLSRRQYLQAAGLGLVGTSLSGWLPALAVRAADAPGRRRQCILLWMSGGPSQMDTFDLKPGHANGGLFQEIDTVAAGVRFSEHLPQLARQADRLALLRGVSTKEGDHGRGTYLMHTGRPPQGPIRYPAVGAMLGKELGDAASGVPSYVSVSPFRGFQSGGVQFRVSRPPLLAPHRRRDGSAAGDQRHGRKRLRATAGRRSRAAGRRVAEPLPDAARVVAFAPGEVPDVAQVARDAGPGHDLSERRPVDGARGRAPSTFRRSRGTCVTRTARGGSGKGVCWPPA